MTVDGFLNLNKPFGFTSHDCVAKVRRILHQKKVGHGGTLDPAATGVLPIALGKATRLLQYLNHGKAYRATIRFGVTTTTDDLEGETLTEAPAPSLSLEMVRAVLPKFQGTLQQIPPAHSAIQVDGKRLYDLARAGEKVVAPTRTVEVYSIEVLNWRSQDFPELEVAISCGGGTYIRAIARDLGATLGVGATLAALIRTESSGFHLADSLTLETLEAQIETQTFQPTPMNGAIAHLPAVLLAPPNSQKWCQGQRVPLPQQLNIQQLNIEVADTAIQVQSETKELLGIGRLTPVEDGLLLAPSLVLV